jgi:hypothetical protein
MSFIPITTNKGARPPAGPRVRLYVQPKINSLSFYITRPVVERVKWNAGDRIMVMLGVGKDAGSAALVRVRGRSGRKLVSRPLGKTAFIVGCTIPHVIGDLTRAEIFASVGNAIDLPFNVIDGQLRVVLPFNKRASTALAKVAA